MISVNNNDGDGVRLRMGSNEEIGLPAPCVKRFLGGGHLTLPFLTDSGMDTSEA